MPRGCPGGMGTAGIDCCIRFGTCKVRRLNQLGSADLYLGRVAVLFGRACKIDFVCDDECKAYITNTLNKLVLSYSPPRGICLFLKKNPYARGLGRRGRAWVLLELTDALNQKGRAIRSSENQTDGVGSRTLILILLMTRQLRSSESYIVGVASRNVRINQ